MSIADQMLMERTMSKTGTDASRHAVVPGSENTTGAGFVFGSKRKHSTTVNQKRQHPHRPPRRMVSQNRQIVSKAAVAAYQEKAMTTLAPGSAPAFMMSRM
jgi:hypothetical protein